MQGSRTRSWTVALVALASGFGLFTGMPAANAQPAKLDAALVLFAERPAAASKVYADRIIATPGLEKASGGGRLSVLIRLADGVDPEAARQSLKDAGAEVGATLGPVVTATIPISAIRAIAGLDSVLLMELSKPPVYRLNFSVPSTGATALRSGTAPAWTGLTGKGVIIGILDDGLDFRHRDFRKPDGTTRLLGLYDAAALGECTPEMINAAINGATTGACEAMSTGGHGTHVGGIAAGNGSATGSAQAAYRFVGMAPEADILASQQDALAGIAWMKQKAQAASKPLVINMSFGSYYGARDGTSALEQALSAAGGPGVILVAAAGNEATANIRGEGLISGGGQVTFDLEVPAGRLDAIEAWYPGTDAYSLALKGPTCAATAAVPATQATADLETACGRIFISNAGPFATNDDRQVTINLTDGSAGNAELARGTWQLTFTGTQVAKPNTPVSIVTGNVGGKITIRNINGQPFSRPSTQILTDTSSAKRVIAVASYIDSNHRFSTSTAEIQKMVAQGWSNEGAVFCSPQ